MNVATSGEYWSSSTNSQSAGLFPSGSSAGTMGLGSDFLSSFISSSVLTSEMSRSGGFLEEDLVVGAASHRRVTGEHATQDDLSTDELQERLAWVAREARAASWCQYVNAT